MDNFKSVFDAYPKVDTIYVVDGMPFITEREANNHARRVQKKVEVIEREGKSLETKTPAPNSGKSSAKPKTGSKKDKAPAGDPPAGDPPPAE